jgi:hypothetical protein
VASAAPRPPSYDTEPARTVLPGDPPPLPPPPPAFVLQREEPTSTPGPISHGRLLRVVIAIGATLAVLAGAFVFVLARSQEHASGTALVLSFKPGQQYRFHLVNRIIGSFISDAAGFNTPIDLSVDETVVFRVLSVDRDGITTARVEIEDATATGNLFENLT